MRISQLRVAWFEPVRQVPGTRAHLHEFRERNEGPAAPDMNTKWRHTPPRNRYCWRTRIAPLNEVTSKVACPLP